MCRDEPMWSTGKLFSKSHIFEIKVKFCIFQPFHDSKTSTFGFFEEFKGKGPPQEHRKISFQQNELEELFFDLEFNAD